MGRFCDNDAGLALVILSGIGFAVLCAQVTAWIWPGPALQVCCC